MKNLKFVAVLAVTLLGVGFLSGCGKENAESETAPYDPIQPVIIEPSRTFNYEARKGCSIGFELAPGFENLLITGVACSESWVIDPKVSGTTLTFSLSENSGTSKRWADIVLSWGNESWKDETSVSFTVIQEWATTTLILASSQVNVAMAGGSGKVNYTIEQPHSDVTVTANSNVTWLTVSAANGYVSYSASDNTSGAVRTGEVTVKYGSYATAKFSVKQDWAKSEIVLAKTHVEASYDGETFTINYTVRNVHGSGSVKVVQSPSWATCTNDYKSDGRNCSLKVVVSKNTTSTSRSDIIRLEYGAYDSKEIALTQQCNLSFDGTANCYIIYTSGTYVFKAVRGNGTTPVGAPYNYTPDGVEVLWESQGSDTAPAKGSIIESVSLIGTEYVKVVTPSTLTKGNAVIAIKKGKIILWSWHLWVTGVSITSKRYNDNSYIMDRNLGALDNSGLKSLGLLYQWGRKDPFPGARATSSTTNFAATTLSSWPSPISVKGRNFDLEETIDMTIENPTTFLLGNSENGDWYYTGSTNSNITRWQATKTIYDPCPPGWKVPHGGPGGVWAQSLKTTNPVSVSLSGGGYTFSSSNKSLAGSSVWYPATGFISGNFVLTNNSTEGCYWSCSSKDSKAAYYFSLKSGSVNPVAEKERANAMAVRCEKE